MKKIFGIVLFLAAMLTGYRGIELFVPQKVFADEQTLTGKKVTYNGIPACDCQKPDDECLCIVPSPQE